MRLAQNMGLIYPLDEIMDIHMPLYIKDAAVSQMAETLRVLLHAPSKTDAVRTALQSALEQAGRELPLAERLQPLLARTRALGPKNPSLDLKSFYDEMWGA